ncbi:putative membrane protein [Rhizobium metallidurans]|uniref:Putative membrane protein n=2 Tax=Rhizobium metallidurans TaxID=1265931 RepID=A0A7W6CQG3_9HYPH|nr:putative membrane protein [Rhizobium metallidurans]
MMTTADYIALCFFALTWFGYARLLRSASLFGRTSLTHAMIERRREWIYNSLRRDLKMIDTQIMAGLQNGTAFFASTSIFAIGSCFALLGAADKVDAVLADVPLVLQSGRVGFEMKVGGLAVLFGYAFFKFGWSYRLFNYCTILFGAIPMMRDCENDVLAAERAAERVIRMNIIAGGHFNEGLRAIFLSIGYLGWFINPYVFMVTTTIVIVVLARRQFFSEARLAIMDRDPSSNLHLSPIPRTRPSADGNDSHGGL